ncbi:hypothetical protein BGZ73_007502 [Actinomortierella ambigua]|nr:hypothetical protein BGZ73_007502 [Actinomortierella ambigua]
MDIDSIFKTPTAPASKSGQKRKLPISPEETFRKTAKHTSYEELTGRQFEPVTARDASSSASSSRGVTIQDEDEAEDVSYGNFEDEDDRFFGDGLTTEEKEILDYVDAIDPEEARFDLTAVRKMILKFEKAINKNQEMRVKYADDPAKFMESEADLDEEIKNLMALTQAPQHYVALVELNSASSILNLLLHENIDIAIDAIELIKELTDEEVIASAVVDEEPDSDEIEASEAGMKALVDALVKEGMLDLLVQTLNRFNEEETNDRQGVYNTLAIFENLTSVDTKLAETMVQQTKLLPWMLKRLQEKSFDSNRQYCSELLAIFLQSSPGNRKKLGELGGIDILLQILSTYKRKDAKDPDEIEMMENLFDALCSALQEPVIKETFLEGEGNELMVIMLREKKMARIRAIKVLDYALTTKAGTGNCLRFVEILGLGYLFSIFMRKGFEKLKKAYKSFSEVEDEEHVIGILASLIRNLPHDSGHRLRLVNKFVEDDYAKLERLLDVREGYEARVEAVDEQIAKDNEERGLDEDEIADEEPERMLQRLDAGLYVMQLIDLIIAHLCAEDFDVSLLEMTDGKDSGKKPDSPKERVQKLLNRRGQSLQAIKSNLQAFVDGLDIDIELAEAARTKLLSGERESKSGKNDSSADSSEERFLTQEEEVALEALEAKESVQKLIGTL